MPCFAACFTKIVVTVSVSLMTIPVLAFTLVGKDCEAWVKLGPDEPESVKAAVREMCEVVKTRHHVRNESRHAPLVPREETCLNLDIRQLGLGNGSCGPQPLSIYRFPVKPERWTLRMIPVRHATPASLAERARLHPQAPEEHPRYVPSVTEMGYDGG